MKITYMELSSLEADLGFSSKTLYALSGSIQKQYRTLKLLKHDGTYRKLCVPSYKLKEVQRKITDVILSHLPVSEYATAYRPGSSIVKNAQPHVGKDKILKLDVKGFFDYITYADLLKYVFTEDIFSKSNAVLLANLCYHGDALPQGAPTSPYISNIVMREFDEAVGSYCKGKSINYTRYCDDMTFSGDFDARELIEFVKSELEACGFYINSKKTVALDKSHKQSVTGVVVNKKISADKEYRRKLRLELYYIKKFGIVSHIERLNIQDDPQKYLQKLLGRVNFVLLLSRDNKEMREYREYLIKNLK